MRCVGHKGHSLVPTTDLAPHVDGSMLLVQNDEKSPSIRAVVPPGSEIHWRKLSPLLS